MTDTPPPRNRGLRTLTPVILIAVLSLLVLLMMGRPCEWYRMRIVFQKTEFGWTDTTCAPIGDYCSCYTADDPVNYIFEWSNDAEGAGAPRPQVVPEVVF